MLSRTRLQLVPLPLPLAGCVTFGKAPLPLACEARLEGRWLPIANGVGEAAKLAADDYTTVDGQCRATTAMGRTAGKPARKAEAQAAGFESVAGHCPAPRGTDLTRLSAGTGTVSPGRIPGAGVTRVRYRIEDDILKLETIDVDTLKRMIDPHEPHAQGRTPPMNLRRAPATASS